MMFNFEISEVVEDEYGWWITFHCGCEAWYTCPLRGDRPEPFMNSMRCRVTGLFAHRVLNEVHS